MNVHISFVLVYMLVWCSLHVTHGDHKDNMCVLHTNFSCSCVQTHKFLKKYSSRVTKHTRVTHLRAELHVLYLQEFVHLS